MEERIEKIKKKLIDKNIKVSDTVDISAIRAFEQKCGIILPKELVDFYTKVTNGCIMIDGFALYRIEDWKYNLNKVSKILLMVAIISAEEGAEGLKKYFLSEEGDFRVKDTILTFYDRGYQYKQSDIELVCFYIRAYINQSFGWIKKMKKSDWNDSITAAFGSILYAGEDTNTLGELSDELSDEICDLCEAAIEKRLGDSVYCIAIVSQHMRREYAIRILKALKDNVRGDAKKEFKKSLKKWNIDVEVL